MWFQGGKISGCQLEMRRLQSCSSVDVESCSFQENGQMIIIIIIFLFAEVKDDPVHLVLSGRGRTDEKKGQSQASLQLGNVQLNWMSREDKCSRVKSNKNTLLTDNVMQVSFCSEQANSQEAQTSDEGNLWSHVESAKLLNLNMKSNCSKLRTVAEQITDLLQDTEKTLKDTTRKIKFFSFFLTNLTTPLDIIVEIGLLSNLIPGRNCYLWEPRMLWQVKLEKGYRCISRLCKNKSLSVTCEYAGEFAGIWWQISGHEKKRKRN